MDEDCEYVLKILCKYLEDKSDGYVPCIDIGINLKDKRKKIMSTLQKLGYVKNVGFEGKSFVNCCVTEKGRNYFK